MDDFSKYLLDAAFRENIAKIILFGSFAKGTANPDSDIDILILTTDVLRIEKPIMDRVYDFMLEYNAPLEVITSSITDFLLGQDFFLQNVARHGHEVYTMGEHDLKIAALRDIRDLADEYLESAEDVLTRDRIRLAIDAAYNAAELAAKGLILLKQNDVPGSHGGVVNLFGQLYVKPNEIEKSVGRSLNLALKLRNEARYRPNAILNRENAREVLNLAGSLIRMIDAKLDPKM